MVRPYVQLQNVQVTKCQGYQTSILQNVQIKNRPGHKTSSFVNLKNLKLVLKNLFSQNMSEIAMKSKKYGVLYILFPYLV